MFSKYAKFIVKARWFIVALWIIAVALVAALAPKLSSVESNNQSSFLPSKYESVQAQKMADKYFPASAAEIDTIVFKNTAGSKLTASSRQVITSIVNRLNAQKIKNISTVTTSPQMISSDGKIQLAQVQLNRYANSKQAQQAIKDLRAHLSSQLSGSDIKSGVTGSSAILLDIQNSATKGEKVVGAATGLLILLLPTIIFRSFFPALLSLGSIGILFEMANGLLASAAKLFKFQVSGQLTPLLIVVLFGIGTDYILFLLFRYRERLKNGDHTRGAVSFALTRAGEAILSAALVVGSAFAVLFTASFKEFSSMAPGLVISVALVLLAVMSLIPALLAIIGPRIFWPSKKWQLKHTSGLTTKLGRLVAQHPGRVASTAVVLLIILATGVFQYRASFDTLDQLPSNAESTIAYKNLASEFPAGTSSPVTIYVASNNKLPDDSLKMIETKVAAVHNVASVEPVQFSSNGRAAVMSAVLSVDPNSTKALNTVTTIRQVVHNTSLNKQAKIAVGGQTASSADLRKATDRDILVTIPVAAVLIFIILALLLRSLVAPISLLFVVGLGTLAALGFTIYAFINIAGNSGLIYLLPTLVYIFVVAVGTDYNILMVTRLREEVHHEGNDPHLATERAIEHSAATLTSAGIILIGTFGSLSFAGLSLMTQLGFSIAIGIALGAFLIALLLTPSIATILGKWFWWPRHKNVTVSSELN